MTLSWRKYLPINNDLVYYLDKFIYKYLLRTKAIKYIEKHKHRCIDYASENGDLDVVKYLVKYSEYTPTYRSIDYGVRSGNLELIKYLYQDLKIQCTDQAIVTATQYRHIEIVRYLHEIMNISCVDLCIIWATFYRDDVLRQYLLDHCESSIYT